jgi:mannitol/fructose-specific phosphotransferase system IIA component (Ntr-type)
MDWQEFLGPEPIVVDLKARNRWEAMDELIGRLAAIEAIKPQDAAAICACIRRRETAMSTGVGYQVAIPHTITDLVSEVVKAVGRSREGIDFESIDGAPVNLVFLYLVPQRQMQQHLHTLGSLARLLHRNETRQELWRRFLT